MKPLQLYYIKTKPLFKIYSVFFFWARRFLTALVWIGPFDYSITSRIIHIYFSNDTHNTNDLIWTTVVEIMPIICISIPSKSHFAFLGCRILAEKKTPLVEKTFKRCWSYFKQKLSSKQTTENINRKVRCSFYFVAFRFLVASNS